MITEKMNAADINNEILHDHISITEKINKVSKAYNKERRKTNVRKESTYSKVYEFTSNRKNNWILILSKAPSVNLYNGMDSISICFLVYYQGLDGMKVFKIMLNGGFIVYDEHFFEIYNQKMSLGITGPLERAKHFFQKNGYTVGKVHKADSKTFISLKCKEGVILGELTENNSWIEGRSFISNDQKSISQKEIEKLQLEQLQQDIEAELNSPEFNKFAYDYMADIMKGIN